MIYRLAVRRIFALLCVSWLASTVVPALTCGQSVPKEVPPRRSTQLDDGFGVNLRSALPTTIQNQDLADK